MPVSFPASTSKSWPLFRRRAIELKRLMELSLGNNRDLRVAALNVEFYQAEYRIQRAELLPTVNATGNYTRSRAQYFTGTALAPVTATEYSVGVNTTSYEVDFFGRIRSLTKEPLETFLAPEETRRSTALTLVAAVATQYLTVRVDEEQLALARQTLAAVKTSYDLVKMQAVEGRPRSSTWPPPTRRSRRRTST